MNQSRINSTIECSKTLNFRLSGKRILHRQPSAPVLLWADGHGSRSSEKAQALLQAANVTFVILPAHSSHVTQPLDCGVNRAFKKALGNKYKHPDSDSLPELRKALLEAAVSALESSLRHDVISKSFEECGLFPYNPQKLLSDPTKVTPAPLTPPAPSRPPISSRNISGRILTTSPLVSRALTSQLPTTSLVIQNDQP